MKDDIKILLNMRKELREQILQLQNQPKKATKEEMNKLQEEYAALGNVISKIMEVAEQEQKEETIARLETQIKEQTRNGRSEIYIDNKDLAFISGMQMSEGRSYVDANQLQNMIDDFDER